MYMMALRSTIVDTSAWVTNFSTYKSLTDMFLFQEKENYEVSSSSSSDMISFDLSNGDPYPPHLSVALDDDQYVEFQVEELADFPSNPDEEERVRIITKSWICFTFDPSL